MCMGNETFGGLSLGLNVSFECMNESCFQLPNCQFYVSQVKVEQMLPQSEIKWGLYSSSFDTEDVLSQPYWWSLTGVVIEVTSVALHTTPPMQVRWVMVPNFKILDSVTRSGVVYLRCHISVVSYIYEVYKQVHAQKIFAIRAKLYVQIYFFSSLLHTNITKTTHQLSIVRFI